MSAGRTLTVDIKSDGSGTTFGKERETGQQQRPAEPELSGFAPNAELTDLAGDLVVDLAETAQGRTDYSPGAFSDEPERRVEPLVDHVLGPLIIRARRLAPAVTESILDALVYSPQILRSPGARAHTDLTGPDRRDQWCVQGCPHALVDSRQVVSAARSIRSASPPSRT